MPLQATSGAASYDAFGGGVAAVPNYIEECFSTTLYTGNGSTQTITNGIDLAGKGGLVWIKQRNASNNNALFDTARGTNKLLYSNSSSAQVDSVVSFSDNTLTSFNANGFTLGNDPNLQIVNTSPNTYASWSFRKQPKFFDCVTYTGNGVAGRQIAHNLGSVPGCIIVKLIESGSDWQVYHRANTAAPETDYLVLNSTAATVDSNTRWNDTLPTETVFSLGNNVSVNGSGFTYVAYLFAHNAGGFGLTGTDNVISCGSYTGNGSFTGTVVNLGFEPQWLMIKRTNDLADWFVLDNMRGVATASAAGNGFDARLSANDAAAENSGVDLVSFTSTGFQLANDTSSVNSNGSTYIYIAIRRGPMRVPTTGTSVLGLNARTGTNANATVTGGAGVTDLAIIKNRTSGTVWLWASRLTTTGYLSSNDSAAEAAANSTMLQANPWDVMDGIKVGTTSGITNGSTGNSFINYLIGRAPGFFDVVCYTGTSEDRTVNHNLGVAPELMILKQRSGGAQSWPVYAAPLGATNVLILDFTQGSVAIGTIFNSTAPTSSVFSLGTNNSSNSSGSTYIAYLFASCPGVSKVGTFSFTTGGSSTTVDCGFTSGPRFVLLKKSNGAGDWNVFDSARGIVSGDDPRLELNTTDVEADNLDVIDATSSGFVFNDIFGESNSTYIYLAIA